MVQVQTGDTTMWTYDPVGNVETITAPKRQCHYLHLRCAEPQDYSRSDSDGPVSTTSYDRRGKRIGTTDGDGNPTTYTYDALEPPDNDDRRTGQN